MAENAETPTECLRRELQEEIGFLPDIQKIYPFDIYESRDKSFRYYSFVCITPNEFVPEINAEAVGYCWCKLGIWPKPLHDGVRNTFASNKGMSLLSIIADQHH